MTATSTSSSSSNPFIAIPGWDYEKERARELAIAEYKRRTAETDRLTKLRDDTTNAIKKREDDRTFTFWFYVYSLGLVAIGYCLAWIVQLILK